MSTTKPIIKAKATTATATTTTTTTQVQPAPIQGQQGGQVQKEVKEPKVKITQHAQTQMLPQQPQPQMTARSQAPPKVRARSNPQPEYVEPEELGEDEEEFNEYGMANEYDEMDELREYENQRMADVFTSVLANVFTYENITLPETILTISQGLETQNRIQQGILDALNKIADRLPSK